MSEREQAWRDRIVGTLAHHSWCGIGFHATGACTCLAARQQDAEYLLPVVREIATEELRAAAEAWVRGQGRAYEDWQAHEFLRDRAEAMDKP